MSICYGTIIPLKSLLEKKIEHLRIPVEAYIENLYLNRENADKGCIPKLAPYESREKIYEENKLEYFRRYAFYDIFPNFFTLLMDDTVFIGYHLMTNLEIDQDYIDIEDYISEFKRTFPGSNMGLRLFQILRENSLSELKPKLYVNFNTSKSKLKCSDI